ncbi:MAG: helix-turn-helix domain-containing protein [Oscillospiraceae bacterium]|nr:helix-turn-helix domain-containing protein [Oscillospiraceae bacterium]
MGKLIAGNLRGRRKNYKLSMQRLAELSGVSFGSVRRFEETGEISLMSLLKIAIVLDSADEFAQLFEVQEPRSIMEIIDGNL